MAEILGNLQPWSLPSPATWISPTWMQTWSFGGGLINKIRFLFLFLFVGSSIWFLCLKKCHVFIMSDFFCWTKKVENISTFLSCCCSFEVLELHLDKRIINSTGFFEHFFYKSCWFLHENHLDIFVSPFSRPKWNGLPIFLNPRTIFFWPTLFFEPPKPIFFKWNVWEKKVTWRGFLWDLLFAAPTVMSFCTG